jgi:predicted RNA-binding Zn ribbon-like protein
MLAVATREATAMAIDDIETYCKNGTWKTRWCNSTKPFAAAASAAELATSAWLTRVKQCDGERCWVLFVDTGKNASRRWCQMRYCGNVAKSHRPAAQRRQVRAAKPRHSSSERNPA